MSSLSSLSVQGQDFLTKINSQPKFSQVVKVQYTGVYQANDKFGSVHRLHKQYLK